ncbi:GMC oxidoreductase [Mycobacterium kubicae]|uniref:GMC oxidoreductase n=1 Tax=Mycobacterium kubicae TaxID=120959 RepID=UPI001FD24CF7|nr:GMC oxidoreductase [Mycobacterium kubicae]
MTADVVVVGAGLSGLEVARLLAADGVTDVLVLDSGAMGTENGPATPARRWHSALAPHYQVVRRSDHVGGRSLRWHGVVIRMDDWALADPCWPQHVRKALLESLYEESESDLSDWTGGPLTPASPAPPPEALLAALGTTLRPVPQAVRFKGDLRRAYTPLERCDDWRGPQIRARCEAVELVSSRGRISGVRIGGADRADEVISAGMVVLAAGTLENSRLVAQLPELAGHGPLIGLNDHLVRGFVVRLPAAALGLSSPLDALWYAPGDAVTRCNVFVRLAHVPESHPREVLLDVWTMGEQLRSEHTQVSFMPSAGSPWPGLIKPGFAPEDLDMLAAQRELLDRTWTAVASSVGLRASKLRFGDFRTAPEPFDAAMAQITKHPIATPATYQWPLGTVDHEAGTLPLGGDLVDDCGRLRVLDGGYVTGPACFPRSGAANPSLTTLALARWCATALTSTP